MPNNEMRPSLDDLAVFLAVSESSGFRAAARTLGQSVSTTSETISRLERLLGVPLFTRTTRSVMLTDAGRQLATRVAPLLTEARVAMDEAASSRNAVRGRLKLNVPGAVMVDILPPLIDEFMIRHPDVRIEIVVEDRLVDMTAADCAAGIRYGEHLDQDMIAVPIGPRMQYSALGASPAYIDKHGSPSKPAELLHHDCIRYRIAGAAAFAWEFERNGKSVAIDPPARITVSTGGAAAGIDLAVAGRGIIYTFRNWLDPHFASGALVPVLPGWWPQFDGPNLYFPRRFMPAPLRAFVDLVRTKSDANA
jgi:DNA-binding transcriptional LysR family regulator